MNYFCFKIGPKEIAIELIDNNADINLKNTESNTVLHIAASAGESEKYHNITDQYKTILFRSWKDSR